MSSWAHSDVPRGETYDDRWRRLEAEGKSIHGEADVIFSFAPESVLDAGCGTGRVAIELDRRGVAVVGVDLDPNMLMTAREKAPHLEWIEGDLVHVEVPGSTQSPRLFDVVAMAGNVMIFVQPGTEADVVGNMARHLAPGGRLICGFQLGGGRLSLDSLDTYARDLGLVLEHRWSTWDKAPFADSDYAVSVHRAPA